MSKRYLETISSLDGQIQNLAYHQKRMDSVLHNRQTHQLNHLIKAPLKGHYRCRVVYTSDTLEITYHPYVKRVVTTLQLIEADQLDYAKKYEDRTALNALYTQRGKADDILIVQNNKITDTTIANIAFYDGLHWVTPKRPLLQGTTRARLLDKKKITAIDIYVEDLPKYQEFALLNAMVGLDVIKNGIIFPLNKDN